MTVQVAFVCMPFGAVRPAIGVSLLKAHLAGIGVPSRVQYLNLRFARLVGPSDYQYIADGAPSQSLAGDWVFSRSAFGPRDEADRDYLTGFPVRFARFASCRSGLGALRRCRAAAEPFLEDCLNAVAWEDYDVIGFTSTFTQQVAALALARRLKARFPRASIVFGGGNCEAEMGLQLHRSFAFIDFVCSGEADISFPRLVKALQRGGAAHGIPGVVSRAGQESRCESLAPERVKDLDVLPYPDYGDYFEQVTRAYPAKARPAGVLMETSRGCWWGQKHHCTFCGLNGTAMTFRSKSAGRVLEEIAELSRRYQPEFIEMVDNILDMRYFRDLIPELQRRQLKLNIFYEVKANLSKEQLLALRQAGIVSIQPGIESLSSHTLGLMRKGTTAAQNLQMLKWCKELGIKAFWNLIYGFPGENPSDYQLAADMMDAIQHLQPPVGFGAVRLDRFSPNFVDAEELGLRNVRADRSYELIYDLSRQELFGLAYYFQHDYADGREPESYVASAYAAFRRWRGRVHAARLSYVDHGDSLAIWDLRDIAGNTLTILHGLERALYLYCDQNRSLQQIVTCLGPDADDPAAIERALTKLLSSRLMVELEGRYLSLAVPGGNAGASRRRDRAMREEHLVF